MSNNNNEQKDLDVHSSKSELFPGYANFNDFKKDGYSFLMESVRNSNALPSQREWDYFSNFEFFKKIINEQGSRTLDLMNSIMKSHHIVTNIKNLKLDDQFELLIDANDVMLEKVANTIDELKGIRKTGPDPIQLQTVSVPLPVNESWNTVKSSAFTISNSRSQAESSNCVRLITAKNIIRPQKFFKDKIDNTNNYPWQPRITEKPNNLKPLAIFLEEFGDRQEFSHPYEYELDRFEPLPFQLIEEKPIFPKPVEETPLIEINDIEQLNKLVETLRNYTEIAVDLEHHSYRTFMGITCLMQISTKDEDYLIDTLTLRDKLYVLNEIFTKPSIIKIFHGADNDIEWLQRDLSLYVVNLFDTHQATKTLEYSGLSLAYLLQRFCNIGTNKKFQLADWRIRPLPNEFKTYAREDTHYLIYIYQCLKQELIRKNNGSMNLLKSVIKRGNEICKKRYFKPILNDESHLDIYRKSKRMFDNRQLYALKELYAWRDTTARSEDESIGYVLPNHMLLRISETLPREMQGILACCNPIPPLVRSNLLELHKIILKAREQTLQKPIFKEDTRARGTIKQISKINIDGPLHCPHDLTKSQEIHDNLPTLLGKFENFTLHKVIEELKIENTKSCYSIFNTINNVKDEIDLENIKKFKSIQILSPFERYKLVKPFVQAEETAVAEKNKNEIEQNKNELNLNQNTEEDPTDAQRIDAIREHFHEMNKKFNEQQEKQKKELEQNNRTLVEMGGTKKRKHDEMDDSEVQMSLLTEDHLQTPFPRIRNSLPNYNKKKKKNSFSENQYNITTKKINPAHFINNSNKNQQETTTKNKHKYFEENEMQGSSKDYIVSNTSNRNKNKFKQNNYNNKKMAKRRKNQSKHQQSQTCLDNNFEVFDYTSFDFRQFRGGSNVSAKQQTISSKFKTKNKKQINKKNTKSHTFNSGKNQGKRSSWRGNRRGGGNGRGCKKNPY